MPTTRTLAFLALSASFLFTGCSGMSRQEVSTGTGAAIGAVAGSVVGGVGATAAGAVIGAVVGHEAGKK